MILAGLIRVLDCFLKNQGKIKLSKLVTMALLIICIFSAPTSALSFQSKDEKYRIIETVIRSYMNNYSSAKGYKLYYIGIEMDGKDVTGEFLKRFRAGALPVKEFEPSKYNPEQIKKEGGIVLGIRGIEWLSKSKVKVYGLAFGMGVGQDLNWIHELKRRGRRWVIVDVANLNLS